METESLTKFIGSTKIVQSWARLFLDKTFSTLEDLKLELPKNEKFNEMTDEYFFTPSHYVYLEATRNKIDVCEIKMNVVILLHDLHNYVKAGWQLANNIFALMKIKKNVLYKTLLASMREHKWDRGWIIDVKQVHMSFDEPEFTPNDALQHTGCETVSGSAVVFTYTLSITY